MFGEQHWLQFFCNLNFPNNFTCPSGKLRTEFTSPIATSTSPGLLDTTFFARCVHVHDHYCAALTSVDLPSHFSQLCLITTQLKCMEQSPQWLSQVQHIITKLKYYENQYLCRAPSCHNFNCHPWVEAILGTNIAAEVTQLATCTAKALDSKSCFSNLYSPL